METKTATFDEIMDHLFEKGDDVSLKEGFEINEIEGIERNADFFSFPVYFQNDVMNVLSSSLAFS